MSRKLRLLPLLVLFLLVNGCSALVGGLRKDLDDSEPYYPPIAGGRLDRGFLNESTPESGQYDRYNAVGHSERSPASAGANGPTADSWVTPEGYDSARRDTMRDFRGEGDDSGMAAFSKNPGNAPQARRLYKNGNRATRADFVDESSNEGSLWASDGQTNYYFTKNKIRGVGDIITLNFDDGLVKDIGMEVRRKLSPGELTREIANAQSRIRSKVMAGDGSDPSELGADRAPASKDAGANKDKKPVAAQDREIPTATEGDIDLSKALEVKAGDSMLAEILERYPNGNYKIRGTKKIPYRGGIPRRVTLLGIVRGADITEEDVVNSGKLYEYRLEATR